MMEGILFGDERSGGASGKTQRLSSLSSSHALNVTSSGKNVYLFSDFNVNTHGLARDVLERDDRALVVFCSMGKLERDIWATKIVQLGTDRVTCSEEDYSDLAARFCEEFRFDTLKCFAISDDCEDDVAQTCRALRKLRLGATGERASASTEDDAAMTKADAELGQGGAFSGADAQQRVARVRLFVNSGSVDDEIALDAANGRGERSDGVPSLRLTVLDAPTMAAYDLLYRAPLHSVLDEEDVPVGGLRPRVPTELAVLVIGSGSFAEEAVKAVLWHGQMFNVSLKVDVAAPDARSMGERMLVRYPELARSGRFDLRFTDAPMLSPRLDITYLERYAGHPHLYVIVALEDDALAVEVAMHARMFFLEQGASRAEDVGKRPCIACLVRNDATSPLISSQLDEEVPGYGIVPFGCSRKLFSYRGIIDSQLERVGQAAADLYDVIWSGLQGEDFSCAEVDVARLREAVAKSLEGADPSMLDDTRPRADGGIACMPQIRHQSNLALALHARYKAWALGIGERQDLQRASEFARSVSDETTVLLGENEHDRWTVFYQTQGFCYLSPEEQERLSRLLGGNNVRHKIEPLRKHALICENDCIWENYLHAVSGFSYHGQASVPAGDVRATVSVHAGELAAGSPFAPVTLQLLDGDYRVIGQWESSGGIYEWPDLAEGGYIVHPTKALPGRECAPDVSFEVRDGKVMVAGNDVAAIPVNLCGKKLVNPVIYDWAFAIVAPYLIGCE